MGPAPPPEEPPPAAVKPRRRGAAVIRVPDVTLADVVHAVGRLPLRVRPGRLNDVLLRCRKTDSLSPRLTPRLDTSGTGGSDSSTFREQAFEPSGTLCRHIRNKQPDFREQEGTPDSPESGAQDRLRQPFNPSNLISNPSNLIAKSPTEEEWGTSARDGCLFAVPEGDRQPLPAALQPGQTLIGLTLANDLVPLRALASLDRHCPHDQQPAPAYLDCHGDVATAEQRAEGLVPFALVGERPSCGRMGEGPVISQGEGSHLVDGRSDAASAQSPA